MLTAWPNKDVPVMSARIAPEPINGGFNTVADYRPWTVPGDSRHASQQGPEHGARDAAPFLQLPAAQPQLPALPPLVRPPGAAFAVALISGQLPPRPTSEREIQMRLGSTDLPAQGSLALHDRRV
jgi:hypothetical protein